MRQSKAGYFVLEGLNSFSTVLYFYYLYFFAEKVFGFGNKANLALAALNGFICMVAAWLGGKFAQRFGLFTALKIGFSAMAVGLASGLLAKSAAGQIVVMSVTTVGMCFTWPTLEALVSEGETPAGLPRMVGIYNIVWAGTGALAYFTGGAMLDKLGLKSLFYVPLVFQLGQLALTVRLEARARKTFQPQKDDQAVSNPTHAPASLDPLDPRPIDKAKMFLRMAWLANPFAYIAINTLLAVMPGIANRLGLSTMLAGFCCSVWCFARVAAFFALWLWPGWHYRFRWLLCAYIALLSCFALILLVPNLAVLVAAQICFGAALGLIYYSSLFYSMDLSDTKAEHGGIHEAAIGLGNFVGPAVGAASLHFWPQFANGSTFAVSLALAGGLGGLLFIWCKGQAGLRRTAANPQANG
jgi:MFS family permease